MTKTPLPQRRLQLTELALALDDEQRRALSAIAFDPKGYALIDVIPRAVGRVLNERGLARLDLGGPFRYEVTTLGQGVANILEAFRNGT